MLPIELPSKIVCVGLNYRDHAEEQGVELPSAPLLFAKWPNTLIGPGEPIVIPPVVTKCDYEAELGVVIGSRVSRVSKENAFEAVRGYICANDVSARDLQFGDGQWTRGKSPDTFCPSGRRSFRRPRSRPARPPHPRDRERRSAPGLDDREPHLRRGRDHQPCLADDHIRARRPDPHGHARGRRRLPRPQRLLQPGDEVTIEIEGVGSITNPVVAG